MRECTICGCDITALQFNRKRCLKESCITKQRQLQNAKKNKSTAKVTGGSVRYRTGFGDLELQPLQMHTPKPIRSSGGLNVSRDVLDQHRREEWARMTGKGVGK